MKVFAMVSSLVLLVLGGPVHAQRFMLMGDSIQAGTGLSDKTKLAAHQLAANTNTVIHNFSSPGARISDAGILAGMTHDGPCVSSVYGFFGMNGLIVALGSNDWSNDTDIQTFVEDYLNLLDTIPPGLPVACMTPIWRTDESIPNGSGLTLNHFRYGVAIACAVRGHAWLDGRNAIPNDPAYLADSVHPNEAGHTAMATFLEDELTNLGWIQ